MCIRDSEYTYSTFGELASYEARYDGTVFFGYDIDERDHLGRITKKTEQVQGQPNKVFEYAYDGAGRLWKVTIDSVLVREYTYDPNGNRLSYAPGDPTAIATYDEQDRIDTYDGYSFQHNDRGDLTQKAGAGETWDYTYDEYGSLVQADEQGGDTIDYRVDGQNRRVQRLKNGVVTNTWLWRDQLRLAGELDSNGDLVARYVSALGRNVPEVILQGGTAWRLITDHLGSVRFVVETDSGATVNIIESFEYDEFGVRSGTGAPSQPFGFAGGLMDQDTGLVRFGAREFDPRVGRWSSRDPIIFAGRQSNLLTYSNSDPVNHHDPGGLFATVPLPKAKKFLDDDFFDDLPKPCKPDKASRCRSRADNAKQRCLDQGKDEATCSEVWTRVYNNCMSEPDPPPEK